MTTKMTKKPQKVMDKPAEEAPAADMCQCNEAEVKVWRWYSGDGIAEIKDGVTYYICRVCGKKYT